MKAVIIILTIVVLAVLIYGGYKLYKNPAYTPGNVTPGQSGTTPVRTTNVNTPPVPTDPRNTVLAKSANVLASTPMSASADAVRTTNTVSNTLGGAVAKVTGGGMRAHADV